MDYKEFTNATRKLFQELTPNYIGSTHSELGTKIKSDKTPVGDLDNYILERLRELISRYFPNDFTIGEEDKLTEERIREILEAKSQYQWSIDGLDGTGNYRTRVSSYGAMIARRYGNFILYAAIFRPIDEFLRGDGFFYAELAKGAWQWCKEHQTFHQLKVSDEDTLGRTVVLLEGSSKKLFRPPISELGKAITTRCGFGTCISTTAVAQNRASALVTVENKPWDNWPAWLLIQEAGGVVMDWNGNPCTPQNCGNMVASTNQRNHKTILGFLKGVIKDER